MMISITLSPRTEAWLERKASATGADKASVASAVLDQAAEEDMLRPCQSPDERLRLFRAWVVTVPFRPGPPVDASREHIYD